MSQPIQKGAYMRELREIKKHNSLTDALTNYSLPAEKLLNAIYFTWQDVGQDSFEVPISDLKKLIGMEGSKNNEFLIESLKELRSTQSFRNFSYGGRDVTYHVGSFLSSVTIYKDNQNFAKITIDPLIISALQQRAGYTPLDLIIVEKFRTNYGFKLYQLYRRYRTLLNEGEAIKKPFEELNQIFSSNYKTVSELSRAITRGIKEIEKITGETITMIIDPKTKIFEFSWEIKHSVNELMKFKNWFLTSFQGYPEEILSNNEETIFLNDKGYFYDFMDKRKRIGQERAGQIWEILFTNRADWELRKISFDAWKLKHPGKA
jgi:hypothetical protein